MSPPTTGIHPIPLGDLHAPLPKAPRGCSTCIPALCPSRFLLGIILCISKLFSFFGISLHLGTEKQKLIVNWDLLPPFSKPPICVNTKVRCLLQNHAACPCKAKELSNLNGITSLSPFFLFYRYPPMGNGEYLPLWFSCINRDFGTSVIFYSALPRALFVYFYSYWKSYRMVAGRQSYSKDPFTLT